MTDAFVQLLSTPFQIGFVHGIFSVSHSQSMPLLQVEQLVAGPDGPHYEFNPPLQTRTLFSMFDKVLTA